MKGDETRRLQKGPPKVRQQLDAGLTKRIRTVAIEGGTSGPKLIEHIMREWLSKRSARWLKDQR